MTNQADPGEGSYLFFLQRQFSGLNLATYFLKTGAKIENIKMFSLTLLKRTPKKCIVKHKKGSLFLPCNIFTRLSLLYGSIQAANCWYVEGYLRSCIWTRKCISKFIGFSRFSKSHFGS